MWQPFRQALRELGYVEGQNIAYEYRCGDGTGSYPRFDFKFVRETELAVPGRRNATGFMLYEYGIGTKWLELLKEIAPGVKRAAVLRDPAVGSGTGQYAIIQAACLSPNPDDMIRQETTRLANFNVIAGGHSVCR